MGSDPASKRAPGDIRLGRYEVVRHLATGGMGAVYLARDPQRGREVAIKVLSKETASRPGAVDRFRAEALHAARLNHENIVTLHDFGPHQGLYFPVLEYVDGTDLYEYITRKGRLEPPEARFIVAQAARALHHASKQGIVHRDIKPSNFLLTRKDGRLLVKLSDFGLARQVDDEEFRVTREGTTVGTVDYMSLEQGRDSRAADVRSDIYSLGCTLYHMLTGHAPFPEGSLTERLYKHMMEEPPSVRDANPRVPEWLARITHRMLAKAPADRYQTPKELLKALVHREVEKVGRSDALRTLADLEMAQGKQEQKTSDGETATAPAMPARRAAGPALRPAAARRETPTEEDGRSTPASKARRPLLFAVAGAVVLAVGLGILLLGNGGTERKGGQTVSNDKPPDTSSPDTPSDPLKKPDGTVPGTTPPDKGTPITWPILRSDKPVVERDQLRRVFEAGWEKAPAALPENTPVYRVCRDPRERNEFASLADAVRAATKEGPGGDGKEPTHLVIEFQDNGPLYERPVAFTGKHVVVRAAPGYRPLLFWDASAKPDPEPAPLFAARGGSLTLEDLEIVLYREQPSGKRVAFARVSGGDFFARRCTFSAAGTHPAGVVLLHMEERAAEGGASGTSPGADGSPRCRFHRCHARGASLVALELDGRSPEVLIDESLLIGGEAPLFEVAVREAPGPQLRLLRSTIVGRGPCLRLRGGATRPLTEPAVRWQAWDTVFARPGRASGGTMIELPPKPGAGLTRQALKCLYTGWEYPLKGPKDIAAVDQSGWERFRKGDTIDRTATDGWPAMASPEPAEVSLTEYRTDAAPGPPVGYASASWPCLAISSGAGPAGGRDGRPTIGCPASRLPAAPDTWLQWTVQSFVAAPVDMLRSANAPAIPMQTDRTYHGERLDITRVDVGARLEEIKKNYKLGPRIVLRLFRSTDGKTVPTSPIYIKG